MRNIWEYIVGATVFGSVTGFIVLLIKSLLKNKINKRYAYLLWMILVIKLIIPFGPESNISLFNNIPINYKMENRTIQRLRGDLWTYVAFEDLELDDSFRMIESTGELVENDEGKFIYVVTNDPYINENGQTVVEIKAVE